MEKWGPVLIVLGLGGVVLYFLTRPVKQPIPTVVDKSMGQCGASYVGVGASIPCAMLVNGIKELGADAAHFAAPATKEVRTAAAGIKPWEYVVTPVAITHATWNELKRFNPF